VTTCAILGKGFITVSYSSVYVITTDNYPTCMRAVALGLASSTARAGSMASSFVGGTLVRHFISTSLADTGHRLATTDMGGNWGCAPFWGASWVRRLTQCRLGRGLPSYQLLLLLHPFNGLFSRTTSVGRHQKGKPFWILLEQEIMGWQWHQLDHMQIIFTSLQTSSIPIGILTTQPFGRNGHGPKSGDWPVFGGSRVPI